MVIKSNLKSLLIISVFFITKIYCSVIQQYIQNEVLNYENSKYLNINDVKTKLSCPGNYYITCVNGCALENKDKIKICDIKNPNLCIKRKDSSRDIKLTTNPNEYNKFMFDYVGHDAFKLFSENSRDYIANHFGSWQWRTGNYEPEVWDSNSGTLSINMVTCEYIGGTTICTRTGTCAINGNFHGNCGNGKDFKWIATMY